jgi:hypothetical protein
MRRILVYFLAQSLFLLLSIGVGKLIGIWFPKADLPVTVALSAYFLWALWRYAKWRDTRNRRA